MIKFSIIVPVYNVEKYLEQCLKSIIGQAFESYEIILINDGSTDRSGQKCEEYASSFGKISVIHKNNGGLSEARNEGIAKAKGEYLIFIDSDDYIEQGILDKLNNKLNECGNNPDVVITRLKRVFKDSEPKYMDKSMPAYFKKQCNKDEIVNWIFNKSDNTWPSVRYIVKRTLIKKHGLKFACGYLHEDLDWTSHLFLYAEKFAYLDFYWYNHRKNRQGSISMNKNVKKTLDIIHLVIKNVGDESYHNMDIRLRELIFKRLVKNLIYTLRDYNYYNKEERNEIVKLLNCNKHVFKYTSTLHHKLFIAFCNIMGFRIGLAFMNFIKK